MKNFIFIFILCLSFGCKVNMGTNESQQFKIIPITADVDFKALKTYVLNPSCIRCHAWAADEASVQQRIIAGDPENSILYQKIKDGSMPPSGPLSTSNLQLVERYIRTIKTTPNVPPTIAIDSTFKSIQFHLIQKSCFTCHNSSSGEISFDGYENIKRYSSIIIDALDNGESEGSPMPPIGANGKRMAPVPTPQIVEAFRGWINAGKIDN